MNKQPQLRGYLSFLDSAIAQQRSAIRFYVMQVCAVLGVGLLAIAIALVFGESYLSAVGAGPSAKWFMTIAGTLVSTLSGFPIKRILDRRERITGLSFLQTEFQLIQDNPGHIDSDRLTFVEQRLRQYLDATLGA